MLPGMTTPESDVQPVQPAQPAPGRRLFSPIDVGIATFLGSVVAGSVILAVNYRRLGRGRRALLAILVGAIATALLVFLGLAMPDAVPRPLYPGVAIAAALVMAAITRALQGKALAAHRAARGRVGAPLVSAGVGLGLLAALVGAVFAVVSIQRPENLGKVIEMGKLTVYHKEGVSEMEARKVGAHLRDYGLAEKEFSVQLFREEGTLHLLLIVKPGVPQRPFQSLGESVSRKVFDGAPLVVDLAERDLEIHTSIPATPKPKPK